MLESILYVPYIVPYTVILSINESILVKTINDTTYSIQSEIES